MLNNLMVSLSILILSCSTYAAADEAAVLKTVEAVAKYTGADKRIEEEVKKYLSTWMVYGIQLAVEKKVVIVWSF